MPSTVFCLQFRNETDKVTIILERSDDRKADVIALDAGARSGKYSHHYVAHGNKLIESVIAVHLVPGLPGKKNNGIPVSGFKIKDLPKTAQKIEIPADGMYLIVKDSVNKDQKILYKLYGGRIPRKKQRTLRFYPIIKGLLMLDSVPLVRTVKRKSDDE